MLSQSPCVMSGHMQCAGTTSMSTLNSSFESSLTAQHICLRAAGGAPGRHQYSGELWDDLPSISARASGACKAGSRIGQRILHCQLSGSASLKEGCCLQENSLKQCMGSASSTMHALEGTCSVLQMLLSCC